MKKKSIKNFLILFLSFLFNIFGVIAAPSDNPGTAKYICKDKPGEYCIPLKESINGETRITGKSGIDLVSNYISIIYKYAASVIGILCVLVIVVSGIQMTMGGADQDMFNQGKTRIIQALLSLVLLFLTSFILTTINPGFFK